MKLEHLKLPPNQLPDPLPVPVIEAPFDVTIRPPGSKSLTNRAILLAALAEGQSILRGPLLDADDAQVMIRAVEQLGATVSIEHPSRDLRAGGERDSGPHRGGPLHRPPEADSSSATILRITGVGGRWKIPAGESVRLDLHNAGTATRFLTAAAILAPPSSAGVIIDGNARMRERPIAELASMLLALGARLEFMDREGFPPLRVTPPARLSDLKDSLEVGRTASSQFISALLLVSPFLERGLTLTFIEKITSVSYVAMTLGLLKEVGILPDCTCDMSTLDVANEMPCRVSVPRSHLFGFDYDVEPDASGATYFWAAAALIPGSRCRVPGLNRDSLQGDTEFATDFLTDVGADVLCSDEGSPGGLQTTAVGFPQLSPVTTNFEDIPDAAMSAAAIACFAPGTTRISGLKTLRVKETDRIEAMRTELARIGVDVRVESTPDDETIIITPPASGIDCSPGVPAVIFDTYDDHRMAMSLALIGLRRPNVFIRNPGCVAKTYPAFWRDLAKLFA